jgi:hypothetical protein
MAVIAATGPTLPFPDVVAAIARGLAVTDVAYAEGTGEPVPGASDEQDVGADRDVAAHVGTGAASALVPVLGPVNQEPSLSDGTNAGLDHAPSTGGSVPSASDDRNVGAHYDVAANAAASALVLLAQMQEQAFGNLLRSDLDIHTELEPGIYAIPDYGSGPL